MRPSPLTRQALPALPRRRLLAAAATFIGGLGAGLLTAGCASNAAAAYPPLATLEVVDRDSGLALPRYPHGARHYIAGNPGARYALRVRNLSAARVLVVLSVDGVNVVSGETADWNQTGYVLEPGRSYDITGWRKSSTQIAAFEFAPLQDSYAALTGRPGNVGVIGMAVFRERVPLPPPVVMAPPVAAAPSRQGGAVREESRAAAGAAAPASPRDLASESARDAAESNSQRADATASAKLGTGHGQREWSVSRRTQFERATTAPEQLSELAYDSRDRLIAAGIIPAPDAVSTARPRPFPSNAPGYVPDPPLR
jgi:hypothetical protein